MLRALTLAVLLIVTALPVTAGFKEGMAAYGRGDHATAFREFKALAEQGDANGQYWLSRSYYFGYGTPLNDILNPVPVMPSQIRDCGKNIYPASRVRASQDPSLRRSFP